MSKSKYEKGDFITSLDILWNQDVVYFRDKVTNRGWFQNWQMRMAVRMIEGNCLRFAIKKERGSSNE